MQGFHVETTMRTRFMPFDAVIKTKPLESLVRTRVAPLS
jgi:hypothetical protein